MERMLIVESLDSKRVAQLSESGRGKFSIESDDERVVQDIERLIVRGRKTGLIYHYDHRQKTNKGEVFRMYGRWSKPGDPDFLDALADALIEFDLFAYTEELVSA